MSQCNRLLEQLKKGVVTPDMAYSKLGIYRLAARIYDLRCQGYNIMTEIVEVMNRDGSIAKIAKYRLVRP